LKIFLKILISPKFFCKKFFLTQIFFEKFLKLKKIFYKIYFHS